VSTPLEAATEKILSAIGKRDFEELTLALRERARLLETGAEVTLGAWELGDKARLALAALKKDLILESSRLDQILKIAGTVPPRSRNGREYFG
jgi:hypothetical protein